MIEFRGDIHRLLHSVSEDTPIAVKRSAASSAPAPRSGAKQGPQKKPSRVARKSAQEGAIGGLSGNQLRISSLG